MSSDAQATAPKLASMKTLVQKILATQGNSTIMLVGDQNNLGTSYVMKVVKREEAAEGGSGDKEQAAFDAAIALARACNEASPKLGHPTLLRYFDFRTRKSWFKVVRGELLMEYINGQSLDQLKDPRLPVLVAISRLVAQGMAHMHRRGVLHGDLKPSSILLAKSGALKIFGYGRNLIKDRANLPGTRLYQAPEQVKARTLDEKTDIYNFGATFYHLMTGQPANVGKREFGEGGKIPTPQALNPKIITALNNLLVTCLQANPEKRPESFFDITEQLDKIVKSMAIEELSLRGVVGANEV